jgi:hypothetical protein
LKTQDVYGQIAAYVDNELKDVQEISRVERLLENDPACKTECQIQQMMKSLVQQRCKPKPTPDHVREAILQQIGKKKRKKQLLPISADIFRPPYSFAITFTVILVLAVVTYYTTAIMKTGSPENMFDQARTNFQAILDKKLTVQFASSDPSAVQQFFASQGVVYPTHVPVLPKWKLLGGVVSVDNGEKFAHQVYASADGKSLVYIFQADERMIRDRKILALPQEVSQGIHTAGYFERHDGAVSTIFTMCEGSVFGIVTNEKPEVYGEDLRRF